MPYLIACHRRPGFVGLISPLGINGATDASHSLRTRPGGKSRAKSDAAMARGRDLAQVHKFEKV